MEIDTIISNIKEMLEERGDNIDEFEEYKVSIYNRLGQLVYELEDYTQFWDGSYQSTGELSSTGVFIYFMEFKTTDGNYHNRKGHITVIR